MHGAYLKLLWLTASLVMWPSDSHSQHKTYQEVNCHACCERIQLDSSFAPRSSFYADAKVCSSPSLGTKPSLAEEEEEGLVNLHTYKFEVRGISAE